MMHLDFLKILALRSAANETNWRLSSLSNHDTNENDTDYKITTTTRTELFYCTMEPCAMCLSACLLFRIDPIIVR